jgi:tetratricopeptide (TPR) repeat protein
MAKARCHTTSTEAAFEEWSWYHPEDGDNEEDDRRRHDVKSFTGPSYEGPICWGGWFMHWFRKEPTLQARFASTSSFDEDHASSSGSSSSTSTQARFRPCKRIPSMEDIVDDEKLETLLREAQRCEGQGRWSEALELYQSALEVVRATGQSAPQMGQIHFCTGVIHFQCQSLTQSLYHLDQALFLYQVQGETRSCDLVPIYCALGQVHVARQDWDRAMGYFQMALDRLQHEEGNTWIDQQRLQIQEALRSTQISMGTL